MASSTRSADDLIRYVLEPKKDQRGERYVMASGTGGLLVSLAKDQMRDVREKWGKNQPGAYVQAYHVIQSFSSNDELDPDDPSDWMTAQDLGVALAEEVFAGRQVLVVTQRDGAGGCLHNHLVASSVNTTTGDSLNSSAVMHARLVETHETVLEREGFDQSDDLKQAYTDALDRRVLGEPSRLRRAATKEQRALIEATRHAQWQAERATAEPGSALRLEPFSLLVLKHRIDTAVTARSTTDWVTFVTNAQTEGVIVERAEEVDLVSFGMMRRMHDGSFRAPTASDRRRGSTIGEGYTATALEQRIASQLDAIARSARTMTSVLTAEDEREVEARMAIYWAEFENERAKPFRARRSFEQQPPADIPSAATIDADPSDSPIVAPTSDLQRERDLDDLRMELEGTSLKSLPAPASAGASDTFNQSNPGTEIGIDHEAPQSTPTSPAPENRDANSIAEARRRRPRRQAMLDFDMHDDPSPRIEGELEL
ncbi:relaxase/mobilization nuclease domain-containing protein [Microbacterium sp. NPDC089320]|uniref:relaxase/mobilization nuclease domain-containing protein n=1 Tax=Microbacterium sp. NPDC089320 TaxID=3155182 RepID=UPI0034396347